jgi:hypothetical protein
VYNADLPDPSVGLLEEIEEQRLDLNGGTFLPTVVDCVIGYTVASHVLGTREPYVRLRSSV